MPVISSCAHATTGRSGAEQEHHPMSQMRKQAPGGSDAPKVMQVSGGAQTHCPGVPAPCPGEGLTCMSSAAGCWALPSSSEMTSASRVSSPTPLVLYFSLPSVSSCSSLASWSSRCCSRSLRNWWPCSNSARMHCLWSWSFLCRGGGWEGEEGGDTSTWAWKSLQDQVLEAHEAGSSPLAPPTHESYSAQAGEGPWGNPGPTSFPQRRHSK